MCQTVVWAAEFYASDTAHELLQAMIMSNPKKISERLQGTKRYLSDTDECKGIYRDMWVLGVIVVILIPVFQFVRPAWMMWTLSVLVIFCTMPLIRISEKLFGSDNTDILPPVKDATGQATPHADMFREMIGRTGRAVTLLRPGGQVRVDDRIVCALAEGGVILKGTAVEVIDSDSMNLIVREAETDTDVIEQSDLTA
jgi:hypothetical protein